MVANEICVYAVFLLWNLKFTKMMTDNSIMPFGKFKGEKLANVPHWYLIWLHKENKAFGDLKKYIDENLQVLEEEAKRTKNFKW